MIWSAVASIARHRFGSLLQPFRLSLEHEVSTTRERVDQTLNKWVGCSSHPLTQVVLT